MFTTPVSYRMITTDMTRSLKNTSEQPQVERETEYYLSRITEIKSIDDFMEDTRVYNYALKAYGLSDMAYAKAFVRKVLEEGIDKKDSFANSLADSRYKELAEAFNFARYGETTTAFDRTQQGTVDKYVRQTLEEDAGTQNEGVRLALYFERKAASLTSPYSILADKALIKVVQTALNLPESTSMLDVDRQAELISSKIDFEDFKDPVKLQKFMERFTTLWEVANPTVTQASAPSIILGQTIESGINSDILASLQNLTFRG